MKSRTNFNNTFEYLEAIARYTRAYPACVKEAYSKENENIVGVSLDDNVFTVGTLQLCSYYNIPRPGTEADRKEGLNKYAEDMRLAAEGFIPQNRGLIKGNDIRAKVIQLLGIATDKGVN